MTEDLTLPSGATLKITLAPFAVAKTLYQAVLEEVKTLKLDPQAEIDVNLFKDLYCVGFSSKKIEAALAECLKKVLYNDARVTNETFEDPAAREDYFSVLLEVARVNLHPFMKNLSLQYRAIAGNPKPSQEPS